MDDTPITPDDPLDEPLTDEQREQILAGIADAEAGRLRRHAEVIAMIQKWREEQ